MKLESEIVEAVQCESSRRLPWEMIAFCAFLIFGVIVVFRFAQRQAAVKAEQLFVFSEGFISSVSIRVSQGTSFRFRLGVPPSFETDNWVFAGEILVKAGDANCLAGQNRAVKCIP